jgi:hypothetical protein
LRLAHRPGADPEARIAHLASLTSHLWKGSDIVGRPIGQFIVALALVVLVFASSAEFRATEAQSSQYEALGDYQVVSKLYFPYVPNGEKIGDTGPWHGSITVQNMGPELLEVWVLPDGRFDPDAALESFQLYSYASTTLSVDELGVEEPGSSLVVAAMYHNVWQLRDYPGALAGQEMIGMLARPSVTGAMKQSSPEPMDEGIWTSDSHEIVDGYSAIPMNDIGWGELATDCPSEDLNNCAITDDIDTLDGVSYLPLAQTNSDWNTILYVTNVEGAVDEESLFEVTLVTDDDADDAETWTDEALLAPGETWEIDVAAEVGTGWIGAARIESEAGSAALAARHKASTNMMMINTSAPARDDDDSTYRLVAPLVFVDYFGWNTGFSLANESGEMNIVTISFYDEDGELEREMNTSLSAYGQRTIYLPSEVDTDNNDGDGWAGTAVLHSDSGEPFHATVDQVKYETGEAMSYTLSSMTASVRPGNQALGLPLLQHDVVPGGDGDTSGVRLFNPHPDSEIRVEVSIHDASGTLIALSPEGGMDVVLEPLSTETVYAPDIADIPPGTVGSVIVQVIGGGGEVSAISNIVNYDVQGDGAVVFGLNNGTGRFR